MLIIHIGYAKTGSTSLQQHFFPAIENITYLGRKYPKVDVISPKFWHEIVNPNNFEFNRLIETIQCCLYSDSERYKKYAKSCASQIRAMQGNKVKVISHEGYLRPIDFETNAMRLQQIFANMDVKILFTIRRQQELITSRLYHDKEFFDLPKGEMRSCLSEELVSCTYPSCYWVKGSYCQQTCAGRRKLSLPFYDFDKVVLAFEKIFGSESVEVLSFEKVFNADEHHMTRLGNLLNTSGEEIGEMIRQIPHSNKASKPEEYKAFKSLFNKECGAYIAEYYKNSNKRLSAKYDLGLEECGYI